MLLMLVVLQVSQYPAGWNQDGNEEGCHSYCLLPSSDMVFGRFGRHISHRDQLSPQRAPEQPGDGWQRHGDGSSAAH